MSLDRSNFESRIAAEPYTVSWKADGTRYMLGIRNGNVYLADRDFRIYRAVLHFPDRKLLKVPAQTARATKSAIVPVPTVRFAKCCELRTRMMRVVGERGEERNV